MSNHEFTAPSRRFILKAGALAGGGLLLSMRLPGFARADGPAPFVPNAFVQVPASGNVILVAPHTEVGQGINTAQAMLVGEELDIGLDQIDVRAAPPDLAKYKDPLLGDQATGGSTSVRSDWMRLREAGATARAMLVAAAAGRWGVDASTCRTERGVIYHEASGRSVGYGDVASDAAKLPVPTGVKLKPQARQTLIGTNAKRVDTPAKVNGSAVFGIDAKVDGMKIGTLALVPVVGGRLVSMDEAAARRVPGVRDVVRAGDEAVAVFGDHMWAAKQGLAALKPVWDGGANGDATTRSLVVAMDAASQQEGQVAKKEGDAVAEIEKAATKLEAIYQLPFLSHSPMEPLNCLLHIEADRATIWVGTQVPVRAQKAVADATGLPQDRVTVNNLYIGGAFGRRLDIDSISIAAKLAKQVADPVKIVWTREEDLRHDYYRPYYYDRVRAGLDAQGRLVAWTHRVTGSSVMARWAPAALKDGLDTDAVECAAETPYEISSTFVDYVRHESPGMNTGWWRGVGPTHNVFVVESFLDELASAGAHDPVAFRKSMLEKNPRALAVLDLAAAKAEWGAPLPERCGRGVSLQFAFGSYVCCVVEVEVTPRGEILLRRATVAIDCGLTVNPDTVVAQIEGGLILGLSTAMYNEITVTGGAIDQSNFHDYRAMRINEAPKIAVHQIRNEEHPGGVGEAGTACAAPALGNAIFAATGQRLRKLPFASGLRGV